MLYCCQAYRMTLERSASSRLQAPGSNKKHGLPRLAPPSFEDKRHSSDPRRGVAVPPAAFPGGVDFAFQRVLPPRVQRLTAEGAVPPMVLASNTGRADPQTQAIFQIQTDDEMLVCHGLGLLVFEEYGHLTEPPGTRTPSSP